MNILIVFFVHFPFHSQGGKKANKLRQCNAVTKEINICSTNQVWSTVICHCNASMMMIMMNIIVVRINQEAAPLLGSSNQSEIPWQTMTEDDDDNHSDDDGDNQLNGDDDNGNDKDDDDDDDGAAITRARSK